MMSFSDLWAGLPVGAQDALIVLALLMPGLLAGLFVMRGFAPGRLVRAMLRRFLGTSAAFVALIALSVGLGTALTAQERGLREGSARAAAPFDVIVAAPGSEITMLLGAVYLQPSDVPLLTGAQYAEVADAPGVALAAPLAFGDSHEGAPVVGTTAGFVTHLGGELAEGRLFAAVDEAVAGAFAPVEVGEQFTPAHGHGPTAESHEGHGYVVTGRLRPSGSPWDKALLVPVEGIWQVHGLPDGHARPAAASHDHDDDHPGDGHAQRIGPPFDPDLFPGTPAVLLKANSLAAAYALKSRFTRPDMMAFFPGTVLAQLHGLIRDIREAMSLMAGLTQGLVTIAVLVGLVILTRVFQGGFALLRATGAPRRFVFAVMWGYSAALIVTGALLGLGLGWLAAHGISAVVTARTDVLVTAALGWSELKLVAGFVSATLLLALLPAVTTTRRLEVADLRG